MTSSTNLFILNLPKHCNDTALTKLFRGFGEITKLKAIIDPSTNQCKGYGFVQFADAHSACAAMATMNDFELEGAKLSIKYADRDAGTTSQEKNHSCLDGPHGPQTNVFIGGIPLHWTELELNNYFVGFGPIASCIVLVDKATSRSKGAAMVKFEDPLSATTAVQALNGKTLEGALRPLDVKFADRAEDKLIKRTHATQVAAKPAHVQQRFGPGKGANGTAPLVGHFHTGMHFPMAAQLLAPTGRYKPRPAPSPSPQLSHGHPVLPRRDIVPEEGANLHIWGLDLSLTDLHLYQVFASYGAINTVRVITNAMGQSKGYGFVQFLHAIDAVEAMNSLNGTQVGSKQWEVTFHKKKT